MPPRGGSRSWNLWRRYFSNPSASETRASGPRREGEPPVEAQYRTLMEQIPAVVFMVYLDRGVGEAYVSPQIETMLGFSRAEWLEDPIRWYRANSSRRQVALERGSRANVPLREAAASVYRVIARDGRVVSFRCDAKMVRTRRRPPVVYPRRGVRYQRPQARRGSPSGGAQFRLGGGGHRRRSGAGAGPGRAHRALQSRLRTDHRIPFQRSDGRPGLGPVGGAG